MSGSCKGMPFSNATVLQRKLLGLRWEGGIHLQQKLTDMKKIVFAVALILLMGTGGASAKKNKVAQQDDVVSMTSAGVTFNVEDVEIAQDILPMMNGFDLARKWAHGAYLKSSFDDKSLVYADDNAFFSMVCLAYAQHRPIVLSPDIMWIIICNGFSQYVNRDPEGFRGYLVNHEGKETLVIRTTPETTTAQKVEKFAALIDKETKGDLAKLMTCDFSTTGMLERMVSQITLMDVVKPYFDYMEYMTGCGIPRVTLEGTPDDWKLLREKTQQLGKFGVEKWTERLDPILAEFVAASEGKPDPDFWWDMAIKGRPKDFHLKGDGGCLPLYGPTPFDGWFLEFIPFDTYGERPKRIVYGHELPPLMTNVPVIQYIEDVAGNCMGINVLEVRGGIVGLSQDAETKTLRPEIGWLVREEPDAEVDEADIRSKASQVKAMGNGDAVLKQPIEWKRKKNDIRNIQPMPIRIPESELQDKKDKSESKVVVTGNKPVAGDIIRGNVRDSEGPMMMVNVVERDSRDRIVAHDITDIEGNFSFKLVNPDDRLQVTYVGYKKAESSFSGNYFEVTMAEANLPVVEIVSERIE